MTFHVKMRKRPSKDIAPDYYEDENWNSDVHWQWLVFCKMALVLFFSWGGGVFWKMTAHSDCVVNPTTRSLSFFIGSYCWCKLDFDLKVLVQCACTILTLFNVSQSF